MLILEHFTGINNVQPEESLVPDPKTSTAALREALNVDINLDGKPTRRVGFAQVSTLCHKNLYQAKGYKLATVDGDLTAIADVGGGRTVVYPSLGVDRVWYLDLPDGRTGFSNGLIQGITDGAAATRWGVPLPAAIGAVEDVAGGLFAGAYRYSLTHVRTSDGLEGGPIYSAPVTLAAGGIVLSGIPVLAGHTTNVYLTPANGEIAYLVGNTATSMFSFTGTNDLLTKECRTDWMVPMPVGTVSAFWRGRSLVAAGPNLCASVADRWEIHDPRKDVKRMRDNITMIQPVVSGIFVGTTEELAFLAGDTFDTLKYKPLVPGGTVLGSGVMADAANVKGGQQGECVICIAGGGFIYACFGDGSVVNLTNRIYARPEVTEVAATYRTQNGVPQYIAIPQ